MENETNNNNTFWIVIKIAAVILFIYLGIKFFDEKRNKKSEESFVERKKTKPKKQKNEN